MPWYTAEPELEPTYAGQALVSTAGKEAQYLTITEPPPETGFAIRFDHNLVIQSELPEDALANIPIVLRAKYEGDSIAAVGARFGQIDCIAEPSSQGPYGTLVSPVNNSLIKVVSGLWKICAPPDNTEDVRICIELLGREISQEQRTLDRHMAVTSQQRAELRLDSDSGIILAQSDRASSTLTMFRNIDSAEMKTHVKGGKLVCLATAPKDVQLTIDVSEDTEVDLGVSEKDDWTLSTECNGTLRLQSTNPRARLSEVRFRGQGKLSTEVDILKATFDTELTRLEPGSHDAIEYSRDSEMLPKLQIAPGRVVEEAEGICGLRGFGGRLYGSSLRPVAIVEIEEGAPPAKNRIGQLVNVNLNLLWLPSVEELKQFAVVEPHAGVLYAFAKEGTKLRCMTFSVRKCLRLLRRADSSRFVEDSGSLSRFELRARARQLDAIRDAASGSLSSGRSRTALYWSILRLQHRGLSKGFGERCLRSFLRAVGYGYRPLPALFMWMVTASLLFLGFWLFGAQPWSVGAGSVPFYKGLMELFFSPLSYFRLGNTDEVLKFESWLFTLVRLVVAVPMLYFVLGFRQYVKAPLRRDKAD